LTRIPVKPEVLVWARETAGLDMPTAAQRVGVKIDRLEEWEAGNATPTIGQVRAMANVYYRPLAALFMSEPLKNEKLPKLPDFRRPDRDGDTLSRPLQNGIMRAHRQRQAVLEIAEDLEFQPAEIEAQFSLDPQSSAEDLGTLLRGILEMDSIAKQVLSNASELLRVLIRQAESLNVMVIQVQRVATSEMRGFSFGDGPAPVVALNGADWPRGKIYSLLHELTHVGFRTNGLCDLGLTPDGGHLTGGTAGPAGRMSVCRASVASTPRSFGSRLPAW
jgi:transcriptional regulator with XRE-family HTH domain